MPVLLNVSIFDQQAAERAPRGLLELFECMTCGFIWNAAFESVRYDASYQVDQARSARFVGHRDWVMDRVSETHAPSTPLDVLEIGAGQGTFLRHLVERLGSRVRRAHGFDPAFRVGSDGAVGAHAIQITASVLDAEGVASLEFSPNVVVARHVIEHVRDPVAFLASLREPLRSRGEHTLVIETPNVAHSLRRGLLHDFYYEHCSLFSETALRCALLRAGYGDLRIDASAFGGEYLFATARSEGSTSGVPDVDRADRGQIRLEDLAVRFVPAHRARLLDARRRGNVVVWGAAGKGAMFAFLVDPGRRLVDAFVDIHEAKHGTWLSGTGHPVIGPERVGELAPRTVVVANGTYEGEIARHCRDLGLDVLLVPVGDQ